MADPDFEVWREADDLEDCPVPAQSRRVFGHDDPANRILQAAKTGNLHHALLFEGERGIGKATTAYSLANTLLSGGSVTTIDAEAHDDTTWRQIAQNAHPALLRLSRPPNDRGGGHKTVITVDEIRRLLGFLGMTTASGDRRVVIIDAVNQLNRSAANALLKLLEEPPARTHFFLISHGVGGVLPTIRSRSQTIRFASLDAETMRLALERLAPGNTPEERAGAARLSGGSVRQALVMLNYGGAELQAALEALLLHDPFDVGKAHALADVYAKRGNDVQRQLIDMLVDTAIAEEAKLRVAAGRTHEAARLANHLATLDEARRTGGAYGLDARQEALVMLADAHALFRKLAA